jgi:hypothetical protein
MQRLIRLRPAIREDLRTLQEHHLLLVPLLLLPRLHAMVQWARTRQVLDMVRVRAVLHALDRARVDGLPEIVAGARGRHPSIRDTEYAGVEHLAHVRDRRSGGGGEAWEVMNEVVELSDDRETISATAAE